jgi:GntR family transcriptional regulator
MFNTFDSFFEAKKMELHPESPVPLYYQLSRFLSQLIQDANFLPGDRFPAEELIASYFHVSRPTANKAIHLLLDEGYLSRGKGLGTFVKEKPFVEFTFLGHGVSLADQFAEGVCIKNQVIWVKTVPANARVAEQLRLQEGEPTVYMRRLRHVDERPLMICDSQLPAEKFPGIEHCDFVEDSLYKTLAVRYQCPVISSERYTVAIEAIEPEIVELLEVAPFSSILTIKGVSYTRSNVPVDCLRIFPRQGVVLKTVVRHNSQPLE